MVLEKNHTEIKSDENYKKARKTIGTLWSDLEISFRNVREEIKELKEVHAEFKKIEHLF